MGKMKTPSEWKKLIKKNVSPYDFQELCRELLIIDGFKKVKVRGGGGDGGRDLEGERIYIVTSSGEEITEKCWFQCKCQSRGINFRDFGPEVQKAKSQGVDKFFMLSNLDTTPSCKDDISNWNATERCRIIDISGSSFLDMLFSAPDICLKYFPDEEVPPTINVRNPNEAIKKSSELGNRFGIELQLKVPKNTNINNPNTVADIIRKGLLKLDNVDVNIKALIYQKISMFFFSLERVDDALMFLNKSLEITPKNQGALLNRGFILEKIDEVEKSTECYDSILKFDKNNKLALNNKAHNFIRRGKFQEALPLVEKALNLDPNLVVAMQNKIDILRSTNKLNEASSFLDSKKEFVEKSTKLKISAVNVYIDQLDLKKAYAVNEELLALKPTPIEAKNNKGVIFHKNSVYERKEKYLKLALDCFERLTKDTDYALGISNRIAILLALGKLNDAEQFIDLALLRFPKNEHVLNKKGRVLLEKGNAKTALSYFEKALRFRFREDFLINKVDAQLVLRQWAPATKTCDTILKNNPKKSVAWDLKGRASKKLHQTQKAKAYFKKADEYKETPISLLEDEDAV